MDSDARALLRMAARLNAQLGLDEVLHAVCEELAAAFEVPIATVALVDGELLRIASSVGLTDVDRERLTPMPVAEYLSLLNDQKDLTYVADVQAHDRGDLAFYRELDMRSVATAVLRQGDQVVGLLGVTSRSGVRPFGDRDAALLRGMADVATQAIKNARLFAENTSQLAALKALYTGAHRLAAELDPDAVARSITNACVEALGVKLAWIGLAEKDGSVQPITHAPEEASYPYEITVRWDDSPAAKGPTGRAINSAVPAYCTDLDADPCFAPWSRAARAAGLRSSLALPLASRGGVLGALNLYSDSVQFFSPSRVQFFTAFAGLAAAAIDRARAYAERRVIEKQLVLADRMASIGTLAAGVAHEINNPLSFVMANLDIALGRLRRADGDPVSIAALNDARTGSARMRDIVRDLKMFSRGDDDRRGPVDVRTLTDFALSIAARTIEKRARVVRDYDEVPPVLGSESRLGQVMVNLVINAAHAIDEGAVDSNEIRLRIRRESPDIVAVEVHDSGCGIPPENLARVFDPFFTTKPVGVGTGLGLSICHGIVRDHRGDVTVESVLGRGTTFTVRLPVYAES